MDENMLPGAVRGRRRENGIIDEASLIPKEQTLYEYLLANSRNFTEEEMTVYENALEGMSTPTGVSIWDFYKEPAISSEEESRIVDAFAAVPLINPFPPAEIAAALAKVEQGLFSFAGMPKNFFQEISVSPEQLIAFSQELNKHDEVITIPVGDTGKSMKLIVEVEDECNET